MKNFQKGHDLPSQLKLQSNHWSNLFILIWSYLLYRLWSMF